MGSDFSHSLISFKKWRFLADWRFKFSLTIFENFNYFLSQAFQAIIKKKIVLFLLYERPRRSPEQHSLFKSGAKRLRRIKNEIIKKKFEEIF